MPKLSVSVPDELWKQAQEAAPDLGDSHLVQAALRRYVGGVTGKWPLVRERSEESRVLLQQTLEKVAERTQATYDEGYRAGLLFAEDAPWKLVEELADIKWDLASWLSDFDDKASRHALSTEEVFFQNCVAHASSQEYERDSTFRAGFAAALGDLWKAFTGEEAGTRVIDPDDLPFE